MHRVVYRVEILTSRLSSSREIFSIRVNISIGDITGFIVRVQAHGYSTEETKTDRGGLVRRILHLIRQPNPCNTVSSQIARSSVTIHLYRVTWAHAPFHTCIATHALPIERNVTSFAARLMQKCSCTRYTHISANTVIEEMIYYLYRFVV